VVKMPHVEDAFVASPVQRKGSHRSKYRIPFRCKSETRNTNPGRTAPRGHRLRGRPAFRPRANDPLDRFGHPKRRVESCF
jgi:hypothetical protein